jgi:alpha-galactosidase
MVNWVTDSEWHNKSTSLTFRFHVAMAGNLGVGGNLARWTPEERALAAKLITQYKSIRHIVQFGDQYRLQSPFEGTRTAVQFVTRDGKESVVFAFQTLEMLPGATVNAGSPDCLPLHGLDPEGTYSVGELGSNPLEKVDGAALMSSGLPVRLRGNYSSRILVLRRESK